MVLSFQTQIATAFRTVYVFFIFTQSQWLGFFSVLIASAQPMNPNNYIKLNFFQAIDRLYNYCHKLEYLRREYILLSQDIEKCLCYKDKKSFLYLGKYFSTTYLICMMSGQIQKKYDSILEFLYIIKQFKSKLLWIS